jgi:hypothetical protein
MSNHGMTTKLASKEVDLIPPQLKKQRSHHQWTMLQEEVMMKPTLSQKMMSVRICKARQVDPIPPQPKRTRHHLFPILNMVPKKVTFTNKIMMTPRTYTAPKTVRIWESKRKVIAIDPILPQLKRRSHQQFPIRNMLLEKVTLNHKIKNAEELNLEEAFECIENQLEREVIEKDSLKEELLQTTNPLQQIAKEKLLLDQECSSLREERREATTIKERAEQELERASAEMAKALLIKTTAENLMEDVRSDRLQLTAREKELEILRSRLKLELVEKKDEAERERRKYIDH